MSIYYCTKFNYSKAFLIVRSVYYILYINNVLVKKHKNKRINMRIECERYKT